MTGSLLAVVVGTYLPWLRRSERPPGESLVLSLFRAGVETGFGGLDVVVLGLVAGVLVAHWSDGRDRLCASVTLLVGVLLVLLAVGYLFAAASVGHNTNYSVELGWYLSVLGGAVLAVVGGVGLSEEEAAEPVGDDETVERREHAEPATE
ncbi:hypothetical protein [Halomarina rubra]|uniref:Uncharacterized protein n=1 Tax=Halomarina rubra TaxID=2071873 RepID=A0ABD6AUD4_9EURY|nr:hypothetical protein [Halomarina rubra]